MLSTVFKKNSFSYLCNKKIIITLNYLIENSYYRDSLLINFNFIGISNILFLVLFHLAFF